MSPYESVHHGNGTEQTNSFFQDQSCEAMAMIRIDAEPSLERIVAHASCETEVDNF